VWPNRIFGADRVREMLNVHLYFVKLFGCHIAGNNIPIDITGFSDAIMHGKLHPRVYLKFGCGRIFDGKPLVGMTDMWITPPPVGGCSTYATWFYDLDFVGINVCTPCPARGGKGWLVRGIPGRARQDLRWRTTARTAKRPKHDQNGGSERRGSMSLFRLAHPGLTRVAEDFSYASPDSSRCLVSFRELG
jgi:hypothetical protein